MSISGRLRRQTTPAGALPASFLFAVIAALAVSTGTWFETIDDVMMNGFATGQFISGVPDEHLVFTNAIIGSILKRAYLYSPETPWYGVYLLVALFAASAAFLWALIAILRSWRGRTLVFAFLIGTISTTVVALQFTRVAFLTVEAGWLLFAGALAGRLPRAKAAAVVGGALVVVGAWIRIEVGWLVTILCAPMLFMALRERPDRAQWGRWRPFLIGFAGIVLICGLSDVLDKAYYRADASWRRFQEFQKRRVVFMDSGRIPDGRVPAAVLEHVGWSSNDLSMLQNWFGLHATVYSVENQDYVISHAAQTRPLFNPQTLGNLKQVRRDQITWLFLAVAGTATLMVSRRASTAAVAGTLGLVAAVFWVLEARWTLPPRFFEPALSLPAMTALAALSWSRGHVRREDRTHFWLSAICCGLVGVLAVPYVVHLRQDGYARSQTRGAFVRTLRQWHPSRKDVYVIWGGDFPYADLVSPLGGFADVGEFRAFPVGWPNHSPHSIRRLAALGIGDPYVDLWQKPTVYLISSTDRCLRFAEFVAVHYAQIVSCELIDPQLLIQSVKPVTVHGPSIGVRWQSAVSDHARARLEEKYDLRRPRPREQRSWRYELGDTSPALLLKLIGDPAVEDTAGLDRETGSLIRPEPDW